jgi:FkbM family methyltransferase
MLKAIKDLIHTKIGKQLEYAMDRYLLSRNKCTIIQIGANDGENLDPVKSYMKLPGTHAILVEPVPYLFNKLKVKFKNREHIRLIQSAIVSDPSVNTIPFYYFRPKEGFQFEDCYSLFGSFSLEHIQKFKSIVSDYDELLICEQMPCISINKLLELSGFPVIDLLQLDVEGLDTQLVNAIDFSLCKPRLIRFEHMHSDRLVLFNLIAKLEEQGYDCYSHGFDTTCVSKDIKKYYKNLKMIKFLHMNWLKPPK